MIFTEAAPCVMPFSTIYSVVWSMERNFSPGLKAMCHTLLEGVWLSDIGRMAEVRYISFQRNLQLKIHLSSYPEMLTTQVAPDSESTCCTAVCVVSLNTNLTNLSNRAG